MKLDPRHLEILAAIVEQGGLTEGARALNKSQPSVSRTLAALEERVGVPLFEANRRPLQPTEFCQLLAREGRRIIEAGDAASALISQFRDGRGGAIRIAGTPIFMDGVVSPMIAAFQTDHPEIRIDQTYAYPTDIIRQMSHGTIDLGIIPIRASEVPQPFAFKQVLPGRNVIACRIGHPLSKQQAVSVQDIAAYTWIAPPADSPLYHDLRNVLESIGVTNFKVSFTGGTLSAVTTVLNRSDALTVLPYSVVFNLRRQSTLTALPIRIGDPDRHLNLISHKTPSTNQAANRFFNHLDRAFAGFRNLMLRHKENDVWRHL